MRAAIAQLIQYRHLFLILTWRDIKIRYKQTLMGSLWAVLMPMLIVAAGILVRKALATMSGTPLGISDLISVSVKALPWAFFVGSLRFATTSLTTNNTLLTKVYFPREVIPFSAVLAHLFDFTVAGVVLAAVLPFSGLTASIHLLWVPLLLLLLLLATAAAALLLSCANLFFRDVKYLVEILLTFGIFFTPVFYEAHVLGDWAVFLLLLNPVGPMFEALNDTIIHHQPPALAWLGYSATWALVGLVLAWVIFKRAEPAFAERI